eukprot:TRINITY_DN95379_c0_g1_i1.p1 TRINITY_DN95379_c0_g1~~TRINITY_DN95379_c0_g1_i1.p1  ORF type:complete len:363 (-),score=79.10 TRINITY_DN95379_c0_g1_i1:49-1137(-)
MAPSAFNAAEVQSRLEEILTHSNRTAAARCALFCAELAQAAREEERELLRARQLASSAREASPPRAASEGRALEPAFSAGAWSRGFYGDSFVRRRKPAAEEDAQDGIQDVIKTSLTTTSRASLILPEDMAKRAPTIDMLCAERTSDRDCQWILRAAFAIRGRIQRVQDANKGLEAEQATPSRPRKASKARESLARPADDGAEEETKNEEQEQVDPQLIERIMNFCTIVRIARGLPQEDDPGKASSASTALPALSQSQTAAKQDDDAPVEVKAESSQRSQPRPVPPAAAPLSPPRPQPKSPVATTPQAQSLGNPTQTGSSPGTDSPSKKVLSPLNRKELHEELSRELAQLAADLRNAQIITSH